MSWHFRPWTIDQTRLLPAAVVDYVPADHLAQFVVALAREHLDLSEIVASYKSGLGQARHAGEERTCNAGKIWLRPTRFIGTAQCATAATPRSRSSLVLFTGKVYGRGELGAPRLFRQTI
jgi:hypothetical protein